MAQETQKYLNHTGLIEYDAKIKSVIDDKIKGSVVDGKSAYEIALDNGFEGTEEEWLESLRGEKGETGEDGSAIINGVDLTQITANMELVELGNLINTSDTDFTNGYILLMGGGHSVDERYCYTGYISVTSGDVLNYKVYTTSPTLDKMRYITVYDKDKNVIYNADDTETNATQNSVSTYTVPENVGYVRINIRVEDLDYAVLVKGDLPSEYIPWVKPKYVATPDFLDGVTYSRETIDKKFESFQHVNEKLEKIETGVYEVSKSTLEKVVIPLIYEQGNINAATGEDTTTEATYFVRTINTIKVDTGDEIFASVNGQRFYFYRYDENNNFLGRTDVKYVDYSETVMQKGYYRMVVRLANGTITPEDVKVVFTIKPMLYKQHGEITLDTIYNAEYRAAYESKIATQNNVLIPLTYEQGNLSATTGENTTVEENFFVRSVEKIKVDIGDEITSSINGQSFYIYKYDENDNFLGHTDVIFLNTTITATQKGYYRIVLRWNKGDITPEDVGTTFYMTSSLYKRHGVITLDSAYIEATDQVIEKALDTTSELRLLCFADPHNFSAHKYLKYDEMMNRGVIDYLVGLGDYVDYVDRGSEATDKPKYRKLLLESINRAGRESNRIYVTGNHDVSMKAGGAAGTSDIDLVMKPKECFDMFYRHLKNNSGMVVDAEKPYGGYFYIDDKPSKIRLIVLNSSEIVQDDGSVIWYYEQSVMSQKQLDWFSNVALKVDEDGWGVMVFLHNITPYRSNNILMRILAAAKSSTTIKEAFTSYSRMVVDENGAATSDIDTVNGDTYSVNTNYAELNAGKTVDVIAVVHGHSHMSDDAEINGIRRIQVRTDNATLDDFYHCPCSVETGKTYYFTELKGYMYKFDITQSMANSIGDLSKVKYFGYSAYSTQYGVSQTITYLYDENKRIIANLQTYRVTSVPSGATELPTANFVRERDGSLAGNESCEIMCINRETRTITTVPYGTGDARVMNF